MNANTTTLTTLTTTTATAHFVANISKEDAVRRVSCDIDHTDSVVWWTADLVDSYTGEVVGSAQFSEHYGEVMIEWA